MSNNPLNINLGTITGIDLLWSGEAASFSEKELNIPKLSDYAFLLIATIENQYDASIATSILSVKSLCEGNTESICSKMDRVRFVTVNDNNYINISSCALTETLYYRYQEGEYILYTGSGLPIGPDGGLPDNFVEVITTTDSVIPLYIYGIR